MVSGSRSFTTTSAGGLLNVLTNQCGVSEAFDPRTGGTSPPIKEFAAIWDTGATSSVITQAVVDDCGLAPTGMTNVYSVHGSRQAETYLINIRLPNDVTFVGLRVTKGDFKDADILIGMDVISRGDFAVTSPGGTTKFSFRTPSQANIDFVADSQRPQPQRGGQGKARPKWAKPPRRKKKKKGKKKK